MPKMFVDVEWEDIKSTWGQRTGKILSCVKKTEGLEYE
jgi:hypothetical protein